MTDTNVFQLSQPGTFLSAHRQRPRRRATEQRDDLAPSKLLELHRLPLARADSIADWQAPSQGLATGVPIAGWPFVLTRLGPAAL